MGRSFNRNRKKFFLIPFGVAALLSLISYVVMQLWNNLLPEILHVSTITFWQAMGIFILCKILFGFGKGGGAPWMRHKMERFRNMSPEEKEEFKRRMQCDSRGWRKRSAEAKQPFAGEAFSSDTNTQKTE